MFRHLKFKLLISIQTPLTQSATLPNSSKGKCRGKSTNVNLV